MDDSTLPTTPTTSCEWVLEQRRDDVGCAAHPGPRAPWSHLGECTLPAACICKVCARRVVPVAHRFSWWFACEACRALDAALAVPYGARRMTPFAGQSGAEVVTLYGRLLVRDALRERASGESSGEDQAGARGEGPDGPRRLQWLPRLDALRASTVDRMRREAGLTGDVPWSVWESTFPTGPAATAAAYQRYVAAVHPWVDSVEQRVADLTWLTALTEQTTS